MPKAPGVVKRAAGRKGAAREKSAGASRHGNPRTKDQVKLGHVDARGIAPSLYFMVDRGAGKRPKVVQAMRGTVELRFKEQFTPVRMEFGDDGVLVQDAPEQEEAGKPDLVISGSLPDIVQLAAAPLSGGVPKVTDKRGRAALAGVARRRVKIEGSPLLARRLLRLLEI
ncbi:MAG TPA: hypothetical protein VKB17_10770 [Thermoleophilaceae bacterium]|nr:hypothetical protein [Thermoleophilaceae bacterium]